MPVSLLIAYMTVAFRSGGRKRSVTHAGLLLSTSSDWAPEIDREHKLFNTRSMSHDCKSSRNFSREKTDAEVMEAAAHSGSFPPGWGLLPTIYEENFGKRRCLENFERARQANEGLLTRASLYGAMSFGDPANDGSSVPTSIDLLDKIQLPKLVTDHLHRGQVLYGQLCTKPFVKSGTVHTVVEDRFGFAVRVCIYNVTRSMANLKPEEIREHFAEGLEVAIKEPYLKRSEDGSHVVVEVGNPEKFIRIVKHEESKEDSEQDEEKLLGKLKVIRSEGNVLFRDGNYIGALAKYFECIEDCEDARKNNSSKYISENVNNFLMLAHSNRAEVMLRMKIFNGAFADAKMALEFDPTHVKSLARLGRAAREIGFFHESCKAFKIALDLSPDEPSLVEELERSKKALKRHGKKPMLSSGYDAKTPTSRPEFVGPVEIRRVNYGDGGRGLFTKESVKPHVRLLFSQPMAVTEKAPNKLQTVRNPEEPASSHRIGATIGPSHESQQKILVQLLQQITESERSIAQLYSLASAGKKEMDIPPMKLFMPTRRRRAPPSGTTSGLDVSRIEEIMKMNLMDTIEGGGGFSRALPSGEEARKSRPLISGLWALPSFINHSCVPNCNHVYMGSSASMKLVSATREIGAGQELTICYFTDLFADLEARQARARELHFTCACERCVLEGQFKAELSEISTRVHALVGASKSELSGGWGQYRGTKEFERVIEEGEREMRALNMVVPNIDTNKQGWAFANFLKTSHAEGHFLATKMLASLADRVEDLIGSLGTCLSANQQGWIRGGFLETYLAKYQLATIGPNVRARISALTTIIESMFSIGNNDSDATMTMLHLLMHEVKSKYSQKSKTYKATKDLVLRVLRRGFDTRDESLQMLLSACIVEEPYYDYSTFSFHEEEEAS